jgi:hypothetical protein
MYGTNWQQPTHCYGFCPEITSKNIWSSFDTNSSDKAAYTVSKLHTTEIANPPNRFLHTFTFMAAPITTLDCANTIQSMCHFFASCSLPEGLNHPTLDISSPNSLFFPILLFQNALNWPHKIPSIPTSPDAWAWKEWSSTLSAAALDQHSSGVRVV